MAKVILTAAVLPCILRVSEVAKQTTLAPVQIRRLVESGKFPRPIYLGPSRAPNSARGWRGADVANWVNRPEVPRVHVTVCELPNMMHAAAVVEQTGICKVHIWRLIESGKFPRPISRGASEPKNTPRVWRGQDIVDWIASRSTV